MESLATRSVVNQHNADHLQKKQFCLTLTGSGAFAASFANLSYISDIIIIITNT